MTGDFRVPGVRRLFHFRHRSNIQRTIDDEIAFHLASRIDDLVRTGLSPEQATQMAEREFGNIERARGELASIDTRIDARARRASWREAVLQDIRYALRSLIGRKRFTATALVTIALGVAATTSIYSIVDAVLLRPLPFRDADRLVRLNQIFTGWKGDAVLGSMWDRVPFSVDEYEKLRDQNTVFERVGIWGSASYGLQTDGRPELVSAAVASASLLDVLGVRPLHGAVWQEADDVPGGPKLALASYEEWQTRFGGSTSALGRTIHLDNEPYRLVGVLPPGFRIELASAPISYVLPVGQSPRDRGTGNRSYAAVARLKTGVSIGRAELEAKQILDATGIANGKKTVRLANWQIEQTRDSRRALLILLGAVGVLLAIACINVAILQLGESATREHEIATRMALGAGRFRLVQQLLTENLVLSLIGSVVGALLAMYGTKLFVAMAPARIPGLDRVGIDSRVLSFVVAISILNGLVFGTAPALVLSRLRPSLLLRAGTRQAGAGRGRLQFALVSSQLALSVVLLIAAGLLTKSLLRLTAIDPGFRADHLIVARFAPPPFAPADTARRRVFFENAAAKLSALPGVEAVSASSSAPFDGSSSSSSIEVGGGGGAREGNHDAQQRNVLPNYFDVMGIPVIAGRAFSREDRAGSELVLIVNESLVRREFPNGGALGARVRFDDQMRTIIGITRDVRFRRLAVAPEPMVYTPFGQKRELRRFLVRTRRDPSSLVAAVRTTLASLPEGPTVTGVNTMEERVRASFSEERFRTTVISAFGIMAMVLAAVGLYGVTSRAVARRNREIGIRVALGATRGRVVALVIRATLAGAAAGITIGVVASLIAMRWTAEFLYDVEPRDPMTYTVIVGALALITILASLFPARRAAGAPPAEVLRAD
jgi:predicted permease